MPGGMADEPWVYLHVRRPRYQQAGTRSSRPYIFAQLSTRSLPFPPSLFIYALSRNCWRIYIDIYTYLSICYIARDALPRKNRDKVVYALKLCPSRSSLGKATLSEYSREAEWIDETRMAVEAGKHIFNRINTYFLKFRQSERGITTMLQ